MQRGAHDCIQMSLPTRPGPQDRQPSTHPALLPSVTSVPVTPGVHDAGHSAYFQTDGDADSAHTELHFDPEQAPPGPYWNANAYFSPQDDDNAATSPSEVAAGARSGEELLRRLSLTGDPNKKPDLADVDPRAAHPSLNLSGGIISATFCVPYSVGYNPGVEWVYTPCRCAAYPC